MNDKRFNLIKDWHKHSILGIFNMDFKLYCFNYKFKSWNLSFLYGCESNNIEMVKFSINKTKNTKMMMPYERGLQIAFAHGHEEIIFYILDLRCAKELDLCRLAFLPDKVVKK